MILSIRPSFIFPAQALIDDLTELLTVGQTLGCKAYQPLPPEGTHYLLKSGIAQSIECDTYDIQFPSAEIERYLTFTGV